MIFYNDLGVDLTWHPATTSEIQKTYPNGVPDKTHVRVEMKNPFIKVWGNRQILIMEME